MRQRTIYQKLRTYVVNQGYTSTQVANATRQQLRTLIENSGVTLTAEEVEQLKRLWPSVQKVLVRDRADAERQAAMEALAAQVNGLGVTADESIAAVEAIYALREAE